MERRRFLQTGFAGFAMTALTFKPSHIRAQTHQQKLGIAQGATGPSATQLSVLVPLKSRYNFKVISADGETKSPALIERFTFPKHDDAVINICFDQLSPGVDYIFTVSDELGNTLDQRMFSTLSVNGELSFTVSSCMDHSRHNPEIWQSLAATNPDVAFFIGDAVYADGSSSGVGMPADPAQLWRTFCESRKTLEFYKLNRLIPLFAVWDDHDFGANDKGKEFMYAEESKRNFNIFFPHKTEICNSMELGPGISKKIKLGQQSFYLMDDRTFREDDGSTDSYAHWGKDQHEWLLRELENDQFAWIMNGSQIFSEHHLKEAMAGHHKNHFNQLMMDLKTSPAKVLFYSGDVHFSEISKIETEMLGYETLELTSSSMHSSTFPKLPEFFKNPRRIEGKATAEHNFNYVKTSTTSQKLSLVVSCINKHQKEIYNYSYQI